MDYLNYMQLDNGIFERLRAVPWFSRCAHPTDDDFGFDVIRVNDWQKATECFCAPEWENTTLEAQNGTTIHLSRKYPREYQEWNKLVREAKSRLTGIFQVAQNFQQEHGLNPKFLDYVKWDVLGIVMEQTYKPCRVPTFFANLLRVYERGRFPCGWKGEWPNGRLIVI